MMPPSLKEYIETISGTEGSDFQKWIMIFCKQIRLPYNKLTDIEKQWLIQISRKSSLLKSGTSHRGESTQESDRGSTRHKRIRCGGALYTFVSQTAKGRQPVLLGTNCQPFFVVFCCPAGAPLYARKSRVDLHSAAVCCTKV